MSPYKNTSVSTGKKYKWQVFCLNLVDSIVKYIQILKVKLKLLVLSFHAFSNFLPRMADSYLWIPYLIWKCACFSTLNTSAAESSLKVLELVLFVVVLQVAICSSTTRCHRSRTLDCNDHALSFFPFTKIRRILWVSWIRNLRCNIL